jgi:alkylhydroperoxidase family enzyme
MIQAIWWIIERRLRAIEYEHRIPLAHLRQMLRVSPLGFLKFLMVMPLARFRRALPPEAYHIARIITASHEDCGTCLQTEVRLAQQAGVSAATLHATLDENPCALSPDLAEVYFFVEAVATCNGAEEDFREAILRRYGEVGLVELSLAIAVCRVFPTVKHVMGYATPSEPIDRPFSTLKR